MSSLTQTFYDYYYLIGILQGICVIHAIRSGNQSKWIWIIVFLPVIGCVAYLFTEVFSRNQAKSIQKDVVKLVNPGAKIKQLEKNFSFSNTFANRVALADAYLEKGEYEKAIELYEPARTGLFETNEHLIQKLIVAYYHTERFADLVKIAVLISKNFNFNKSQSGIYYGLSLEKIGDTAGAEQQLSAMNHRFSNYEARYHYGCFLMRQGKAEDAEKVFEQVLTEAESLGRKEKAEAKVWINKSRDAWNSLEV